MTTQHTWTDFPWLGTSILIVRDPHIGATAIYQAIRDYAAADDTKAVLVVTDKDIPTVRGQLLAAQPELVTTPDAGEIKFIPWEPTGRNFVALIQRGQDSPGLSFVVIDVADFDSSTLLKGVGRPVLVVNAVSTYKSPGSTILPVAQDKVRHATAVFEMTSTGVKVHKHPDLNSYPAYIRVDHRSDLSFAHNQSLAAGAAEPPKAVTHHAYLVGKLNIHKDVNGNPPAITSVGIYSSPANSLTSNTTRERFVDLREISGPTYQIAYDNMIDYLGQDPCFDAWAIPFLPETERNHVRRKQIPPTPPKARPAKPDAEMQLLQSLWDELDAPPCGGDDATHPNPTMTGEAAVNTLNALLSSDPIRDALAGTVTNPKAATKDKALANLLRGLDLDLDDMLDSLLSNT